MEDNQLTKMSGSVFKWSVVVVWGVAENDAPISVNQRLRGICDNPSSKK